MYENEMGSKQEKHIEIAHEMTMKICEFTPEEQNEMVKIIYDLVYENRQGKIDEAEKKFIHLKDTIMRLEGKENPNGK